MQQASTPGFTSVPRTGVIYVTGKARQAGFEYGSTTWANLGQGAPEVGALWEGDDRLQQLPLAEPMLEYAPVAGLQTLREAVAKLYNELYRQDKASKYTAKNVAICAGGRLALTRLAASLGEINFGHFLPDYTAYEELLNTFHRFKAIPMRLPDNSYCMSAPELEQNIRDLGLQAVLVSNPCNPTGHMLAGQDLADWVAVARTNNCSILFDEFYSHYAYAEPNSVSAAAHVEDVNTDPIIIIDGLTKNWRYPGMRLSWTVGPEDVIEAVTSAGSFLDGGAMHAVQTAAIPLLQPDLVRQNQQRLVAHFAAKKQRTMAALSNLGFNVTAPAGSFYCWAGLQNLPTPLRDGMALFEAGLQEQVITVPGVFFDINPGKRRQHSRYQEYSRISFGPDNAQLERGFKALKRVIEKHR